MVMAETSTAPSATSRAASRLPTWKTPVAQPAAKHQSGGILFCRRKGAEGRGHRTPDGFVVLKGSTAVLQERESAKNWPAIRHTSGSESATARRGESVQRRTWSGEQRAQASE